MPSAFRGRRRLPRRGRCGIWPPPAPATPGIPTVSMHKGYLSDGTGFVDIKFDKIYDVFSRLSRGCQRLPRCGRCTIGPPPVPAAPESPGLLLQKPLGRNHSARQLIGYVRARCECGAGWRAGLHLHARQVIVKTARWQKGCASHGIQSRHSNAFQDAILKCSV